MPAAKASCLHPAPFAEGYIHCTIFREACITAERHGLRTHIAVSGKELARKDRRWGSESELEWVLKKDARNT